MEHLKYPIGKFNYETEILDSEINSLISEIENLPTDLKKVVDTLNEEQLNIPYRPGGWTVKQVIHHLVDSHMNAYIRFNLVLTEESPTIKPYKENLWAELPYKNSQSINNSLQLIALIHTNWVLLLRSVTINDFNKKSYIHPEYNRVYTLKKALGTYAWHGKHHLAHITSLIKRNFDK